VPQHSTRERDPSSSAKAEHSGKRLPSPSAMVKALGEEIFPTAPSVYAVKCDFSFTCASLPRVLPSFPECLSLFGTRESLSSPSVRVASPSEFRFSRSATRQQQLLLCLFVLRCNVNAMGCPVAWRSAREPKQIDIVRRVVDRQLNLATDISGSLSMDTLAH
jgi:hypothetical protein